MLGYVSDAALAELYRRCAVFCYPSLGEGFGLPVLEAMAAGAAVITSKMSSLAPEVGGDAAEYVDPCDVASIADGLRRVLGDEPRRAQLSREGVERAGEFSWESLRSECSRRFRPSAARHRRRPAALPRQSSSSGERLPPDTRPGCRRDGSAARRPVRARFPSSHRAPPARPACPPRPPGWPAGGCDIDSPAAIASGRIIPNCSSQKAWGMSNGW